MTFHDPELLNPVVHCFARCFMCKKLIAIRRNEKDELIFAERKCPHCGVFIEEDQILGSFAANLFHTSGIASSNKLQSLDLLIIPFLGVGVLLTVMGFPVWFRIVNLLIYLLPAVVTAKWLHRYWYRIRFDDVEYIQAIKGVKRSFLLWLFANLLNWLLLLLQPLWILTW